MNNKYITKNCTETQKIGSSLAGEILSLRPQKTAVVLALRGNLGAGKTTFLQGFAGDLGIKEKVNSPTFVILKRFKIYNLRFKNFYHIDCYRLHSPKEILDLGFKEIIANPKNIVAIEWPGIISKILPKKKISINFGHLEENRRSLLVKK